MNVNEQNDLAEKRMYWRQYANDPARSPAERAYYQALYNAGAPGAAPTAMPNPPAFDLTMGRAMTGDPVLGWKPETQQQFFRDALRQMTGDGQKTDNVVKPWPYGAPLYDPNSDGQKRDNVGIRVPDDIDLNEREPYEKDTGKALQLPVSDDRYTGKNSTQDQWGPVGPPPGYDPNVPAGEWAPNDPQGQQYLDWLVRFRAQLDRGWKPGGSTSQKDVSTPKDGQVQPTNWQPPHQEQQPPSPYTQPVQGQGQSWPNFNQVYGGGNTGVLPPTQQQQQQGGGGSGIQPYPNPQLIEVNPEYFHDGHWYPSWRAYMKQLQQITGGGNTGVLPPTQQQQQQDGGGSGIQPYPNPQVFPGGQGQSNQGALMNVLQQITGGGTMHPPPMNGTPPPGPGNFQTTQGANGQVPLWALQEYWGPQANAGHTTQDWNAFYNWERGAGQGLYQPGGGLYGGGQQGGGIPGGGLYQPGGQQQQMSGTNWQAPHEDVGYHANWLMSPTAPQQPQQPQQPQTSPQGTVGSYVGYVGEKSGLWDPSRTPPDKQTGPLWVAEGQLTSRRNQRGAY